MRVVSVLGLPCPCFAEPSALLLLPPCCEVQCGLETWLIHGVPCDKLPAAETSSDLSHQENAVGIRFSDGVANYNLYSLECAGQLMNLV